MTEEQIGAEWRKMARKEGHVRGFPVMFPKAGGRPKSMSRSERRVLSLLEVRRMTTGELAQAMGLDISSVRGVCRNLVGSGKVWRVELIPMPNGGRTAVWGLA